MGGGSDGGDLEKLESAENLKSSDWRRPSQSSSSRYQLRDVLSDAPNRGGREDWHSLFLISCAAQKKRKLLWNENPFHSPTLPGL